MRQALNNPWVVLGLCAVAAVILYLNGAEFSVENGVTARRLPVRLPLVSASTVPTITQSNVDYAQLDWPETPKRDPFAPMPAPMVKRRMSLVETDREVSDSESSDEPADFQPPPLRLTAVALEPKPKTAMINRKIVEEGDRIEGLRVSRIESDGVWLMGPSGPHRLAFQAQSAASRPVKRAANSAARSEEPQSDVRTFKRESEVAVFAAP